MSSRLPDNLCVYLSFMCAVLWTSRLLSADRGSPVVYVQNLALKRKETGLLSAVLVPPYLYVWEPAF